MSTPMTLSPTTGPNSSEAPSQPPPTRLSSAVPSVLQSAQSESENEGGASSTSGSAYRRGGFTAFVRKSKISGTAPPRVCTPPENPQHDNPPQNAPTHRPRMSRQPSLPIVPGDAAQFDIAGDSDVDEERAIESERHFESDTTIEVQDQEKVQHQIANKQKKNSEYYVENLPGSPGSDLFASPVSPASFAAGAPQEQAKAQEQLRHDGDPQHREQEVARGSADDRLRRVGDAVAALTTDFGDTAWSHAEFEATKNDRSRPLARPGSGACWGDAGPAGQSTGLPVRAGKAAGIPMASGSRSRSDSQTRDAVPVPAPVVGLRPYHEGEGMSWS